VVGIERAGPPARLLTSFQTTVVGKSGPRRLDARYICYPWEGIRPGSEQADENRLHDGFRSIQGDWSCRGAGQGDNHKGLYTCVLRHQQSQRPKGDRGSIPNFKQWLKSGVSRDRDQIRRQRSPPSLTTPQDGDHWLSIFEPPHFNLTPRMFSSTGRAGPEEGIGAARNPCLRGNRTLLVTPVDKRYLDTHSPTHPLQNGRTWRRWFKRYRHGLDVGVLSDDPCDRSSTSLCPISLNPPLWVTRCPRFRSRGLLSTVQNAEKKRLYG